jgi:putative ABC transport system permease protein
MFSVIRAVLLRPLPYHDPGRLYEITGVDGSGRATLISIADFLSIRERAASFERAAVSALYRAYILTGVPEPASVFARLTNAAFLPTLGVSPRLGRSFTDDDCAPGAPPVAIISHRLWQQNLQGDPGVVGRSILLNGEDHKVIGVMPPGFHYPQRVFDLWLPLKPNAQDLHDRSRRSGVAIARLKPGVRPEQARAELESLARDLAGLAGGALSGPPGRRGVAGPHPGQSAPVRRRPPARPRAGC